VSVLQKRPHLILAVIAALMLFGALGRWPYGYYQLLRWVTCGACVWIAVIAYSWQKIWVTWLFGIIAILFNPIVPIHLSREIWQPINIVCACVFFVLAFAIKKPLHFVGK
jgi:hypothetical protein